MSYALNRYEQHLSLSHKDLMALGRLNADDEDETFCMTVLALNTARAANGVVTCTVLLAERCGRANMMCRSMTYRSGM